VSRNEQLACRRLALYFDSFFCYKRLFVEL